MDAAELKKQLISQVITPFFKENGFTKKGAKYSKKINHVIVEADIQSQRFYTEENVKSFRINIGIYPDIPENAKTRFIGIRHHTVFFEESGWITIDSHTNIEELKSELATKLDDALLAIEESNDLDKLIIRAEAMSEIIRDGKTIEMLNGWLKAVRGQK